METQPEDSPPSPAEPHRPHPPATQPTESWALRTGLSISVWLLAGVATVLAASGQIQFAHWAGINDIRAYAVPAVLELVAVAFLLIGYRRARRGDSPAALWLLAAGVGGFAVYTNVAHSGRAGLVFGAASAITLILWFVKLRDDYRHSQRHTGQATRPRPKFGALWLVAPRLSARAWIVAARRRISTVDESIAYAEVWRAVYQDSRTARIGRGLARRTAWRSVAEASGGVWADLPMTAQVAAVDVIRRSPPDPSRTALATPDAGAGIRATTNTLTAAPMHLPPTRTLPVAPRQSTTNGHHTYQPALTRPGPTAADNHPLATRVHDFLDDQINPSDYQHLDETHEAHLLWTTARALHVDVEEIADAVRSWLRDVSTRPQPAT